MFNTDLKDKIAALKAEYQLTNAEAVNAAIQMQRNEILKQAYNVDPFNEETASMPYLEAISVILGYKYPNQIAPLSSTILSELQEMNDPIQDQLPG